MALISLWCCWIVQSNFKLGAWNISIELKCKNNSVRIAVVSENGNLFVILHEQNWSRWIKSNWVCVFWNQLKPCFHWSAKVHFYHDWILETEFNVIMRILHAKSSYNSREFYIIIIQIHQQWKNRDKPGQQEILLLHHSDCSQDQQTPPEPTSGTYPSSLPRASSLPSGFQLTSVRAGSLCCRKKTQLLLKTLKSLSHTSNRARLATGQSCNYSAKWKLITISIAFVAVA